MTRLETFTSRTKHVIGIINKILTDNILKYCSTIFLDENAEKKQTKNLDTN